MIFQKFIIFLFLSDFSKVCLFFPKTYNLTFWTHDHINLACRKFTWKVETKYFILFYFPKLDPRGNTIWNTIKHNHGSKIYPQKSKHKLRDQ